MDYATKIWIFWMAVIISVAGVLAGGLYYLGHSFKIW